MSETAPRTLASLTKLERQWLRRRYCGWCEQSALASRCGAIDAPYTLRVIDGERERVVDLGPPCDMDERRGNALLGYKPRPPRTATMTPTYQPPPPRALTDDERLMLRCSAAGGPHPVRATGSSQHALCRRLAKMGLGTFEEGAFTVNARGEAAVA